MSRPFRRCGRSKRRFIAESTDGEPPKRELADLLRSNSEQGGWLPHLALEARMDSALWLGSEARGTNYDLKADDRFIWAPFGVRGIPPVWNGRIEISAGAGGTYEKYWVSNPQPSGRICVARWMGRLCLGRRALGARSAAPLLAGCDTVFLSGEFKPGGSRRWFVLNAGLGFRF